ncbi:hypothetical protein TNCV_2312761 [Trichonephila clavipes]|nr:hypothetical protein TNCV_2312761 [Trichonephila clavipes]
MSESKYKVMLIVFFDINGIVMIECVPSGQIVIQQHYIEVLKRLWEKAKCEVMASCCTMLLDLAPCDVFLNFPQLNLAEREPILPQLKRSRLKRRTSRRVFQKPRSRTVTNNGSTKCRIV